MKKVILIFLVLISFVFSQSIKVDDTTNDLSILPYATIYLDETKKLSISEIKQKEFKINEKPILGYGFSPGFNFWSKFTITNSSNKNIKKIIEFEHPITYKIILYENNKKPKFEGLVYKPKERLDVNPNFTIQLKPKESKTFYLKASTVTTGLIIKLKLYNIQEYHRKELHYQVALSIFFGAMMVLGIYNLFLYLFTKDNAYLYYVLYIFAMVFHQSLYLGFAQVYLFSNQISTFILDLAVAKVFLPLFASILFTREFLNTKRYPFLDKIFTTYLIAMPIISILCYKSIILGSSIVLIVIPLLFLLIFAGIKALLDKNKLAPLYLLGWSAVLSCWLFMAIANLGFFNIFVYVPYYVEIALVFEALIFSIALAKRINILQGEKQHLNKKLILQQQNEKEKLKIEVTKKTKDLVQALHQKELVLDEKALLFKELHHRVKNNMQMIISLINLQNKKANNNQIKDFFQVAINRIKAMSSLHELLYSQDELSNISAYDYFFSLIKGLKATCNKDIDIHYDIKCNLDSEDAIYCGLIINELVSNSLKYAFTKKGTIHISLSQKNDLYILQISDNGIGNNKTSQTDSLGLLIVQTLVEQQLEGVLDTINKNGVQNNIKWKNKNA